MSRVRVLSACCVVSLCLTLLSPAAASGQTEAYTIKNESHIVQTASASRPRSPTGAYPSSIRDATHPCATR